METEKHMNEMLRLFERSIPDPDTLSRQEFDDHLYQFMMDHVEEIRCTYSSVPAAMFDTTIPDRVDEEITLINIPGLERQIDLTITGMRYDNNNVSCYRSLSFVSQKYIKLLFDVCFDRFPKKIER